MWQNRSKIIFVSSVVIAGLVLIQMGMYALHVLYGWELRFSLLQICNNWMKSKGIFSVGHILGALVAYTFVMCCAVIGRQLLLGRRALRKLLGAAHAEYSSRLNRHYGYSGSEKLTVVRCVRPAAFTMGFFKRRIFLTTALLDLLDNKEAEAVIHHERFHRKHADPLKTFILSLFAAVFWYIPLMDWCHRHYKIARELQADSYAIGAMGSSVELGSALLKLVKNGTPAGPLRFAHVSFADTSVNYRIRQILDPLAEIPFKLPLTPTMISVHIVLMLSILYIIALF